MGRTNNMYGGDAKFIQDFSQKLEGKRPFGRSRHRWE
jgi:hypothetical protein